MKKYILITILFLFLQSVFTIQVTEDNTTTAKFQSTDVSIEIKKTYNNSLYLENPVHFYNNMSEIITLFLTFELKGDKMASNQSSIVEPIPHIFIKFNDTSHISFNITGRTAGLVYLGIGSRDSRFMENKSVYCKVQVIRSHLLKVLGDVIGWLYFVAWTISFYPQLILNIRKKSVVGLNFDFLIYNWIGFFSYTVFNVGLFWIDFIKNLYNKSHPNSSNPVQLNDVIFSLHAILIVSIQLIQCCIYERKGQKISKFCYGLTSCMLLYIIIIVSVAGSGVKSFTWLEFMYYISYLKLFITLIKYIPQAVMNYRRKSTVGWSIGNIFLDFTGGFLSIVQMIIISYNDGDWSSYFNDPTKFGLGLFSIIFDILFMVQHYILYRGAEPITYSVFDNDELHSTIDTK